jgi:hypothetical protein
VTIGDLTVRLRSGARPSTHVILVLLVGHTGFVTARHGHYAERRRDRTSC